MTKSTTGHTHEIISKDMAAYLDTQKATPVPKSSAFVALITIAGIMGFRKRNIICLLKMKVNK